MEKNNRLWFVRITVLLLFVFQQFTMVTARFVANSFSYDRIDPYNIFAWVSVHHIVQMVIALVAIGIFAKAKNLDFGFRLGDVKVGLEHTLNFSIIVLIYVIVNNIIGYFVRGFYTPDFPLNITNVAGTLGFQLFLSGTSEEILFRTLPITLLTIGCTTSKSIQIYKWEIPSETMIAAVLFAIAHIGWELNPFSITQFNIHQLILSVVFGIFYGLAYQKSKSVLYPMIMHGISNFVIVGAWYILSIFFG